MDIFEKIQRRAKMHLLIDPQFFQQIPQKNYWSLAVTHRPKTLFQRTLEQAESAGLFFHSPFPETILCRGRSESQFQILEEKIALQHLPLQVRQSYSDTTERPFAIRPGLTLKDMEKELILSTLRQTENNRTRAAEILGITRQTLQNKLKEYGLT